MSLVSDPVAVTRGTERRAGVQPPKKREVSILIVDDEPGIRSFLQRAMARDYGLVEAVDAAEAAEELRQRYRFDLFIVDVRLPGRSGLEWVEDLRRQGIDSEVIFITGYADLDATITALRAGAADFILKPFRLEHILASVERCLERRALRSENTALRRQVDDFAERLYGTAGIAGQGRAIREVCEIIKRVAPTRSSVLIEGETGTGKELAASAIHRFSGRKGPFVPVNCVAISAELFESELFGHKKGAFTGAHEAREGLFTFANGGTLFLDEISEMPAAMQAKLLRVLEGRKVRPVGSDREVPVDVRLIAASNQDLSAAVHSGRFREDLYYRLNVVALRMPPLREREEDQRELVEFFARSMAVDLGVKPIAFSEQDLLRMRSYTWPGNVRELKNFIERSLLLGRPPWETIEHAKEESGATGKVAPVGFPVNLSLEEVEKRHTLKVLEASRGNKSEAARRLGVSRKTLERKLRSWPEAKTV